MLKELKKNKKLIFILILFLIIPFFRFPDLRNEMKYLDIIKEMIDKKSYWILYYQGELYPDKPPLYFWLLIIIYKIFGENLVFPLSLILFSYLPFLGVLFLGYWQLEYLKKEWRSNFLIYSLTIPYLMGISIFLRMDMLMTFFITLVLSLFIYFYYNQNKITKIEVGDVIQVCIESTGMIGAAVKYTIWEKDGKTKTTVEKTFPGYVLVEMVMSDQAWYVVRNTPGVTGFVGSHGAGSKPSPLLPEEVEAILGRIGEKVHAPVDLHVSVGDYVIITEGAFNDMSGKVVELDHEKQKIKVAIEMFGRETIADLEFHQVKEDDSY